MPQTATIKSLPGAFAMMKAMQAEGVEWCEDYRGATRQALAELLEGRMDQLIDAHLERMAELGQADRRNGCYRRWLLTELGEIELALPRTRTFSALRVVRAYARRAKDVDRPSRIRGRRSSAPDRRRRSRSSSGPSCAPKFHRSLTGPCFGLEPPLVRSWAVMAAGVTTDCGKPSNRSTLSRRHAAGGATGSISCSP
jgi:mutator family transposase